MTTTNVFVPGLGEVQDQFENSAVGGLFTIGHHLAGEAMLEALGKVNEDLANGIDVATAVSTLKKAIEATVVPAVDRWLEVAVRFNDELSCR